MLIMRMRISSSGDLLQLHLRGGARGDDDPLAGAELLTVSQLCQVGRLEHRRLRPALLRRRGDEGA
eukprot:5515017-Pyramimonas_sp.AAC.1